MAKSKTVKIDRRTLPKKATRLTAEAVVKLLKKGWTVGRVAAKYGITRQTIYARYRNDILGVSPVGYRPRSK